MKRPEIKNPDHPLVKHALATLANADDIAEDHPWPYPEGTEVMLVTPAGIKHAGKVLECEAEGWMLIEMVDPPDFWEDNPLRFHSFTWPERYLVGGKLAFQTSYRQNRPADLDVEKR